MFHCENCKTFKDFGSNVYLMECASDNSVPTCSEECGEIIRQREIKKIENSLNTIKNAKIQKDIW